MMNSKIEFKRGKMGRSFSVSSPSEASVGSWNILIGRKAIRFTVSDFAFEFNSNGCCNHLLFGVYPWLSDCLVLKCHQGRVFLSDCTSPLESETV